MTNVRNASQKTASKPPAKAGAKKAPEKVPTSSRVISDGARLFREQGYAVSTTRELSARLGITKASLYYHIASKEDLLRLICLESLHRVTESVTAAVEAETDPLAKVRAVLSAHLESVLGDLDLHATMLQELRSLTGAYRDQVQLARDAYENLVVDVITEAQAAGALRSDLTVKVLAFGLLSLLNWTISWYRPGGGLTPSELADNFWALYLGGAQAPA
ncbi:regulatory protein TetR [Mycolicibacterium rhodesiae JS60]|nr:regulatory protein TetR [Mycolicibacterium rhodesiae JS60]